MLKLMMPVALLFVTTVLGVADEPALKEYEIKIRFVAPEDKVEPLIIVPPMIVLEGKTAEHRTGFLISHGGPLASGLSNIPAGGQSVCLKCGPAGAGKVHLHLEAERSKVLSSSPPVSTVNVTLKTERHVPLGKTTKCVLEADERGPTSWVEVTVSEAKD